MAFTSSGWSFVNSWSTGTASGARSIRSSTTALLNMAWSRAAAVAVSAGVASAESKYASALGRSPESYAIPARYTKALGSSL